MKAIRSLANRTEYETMNEARRKQIIIIRNVVQQHECGDFDEQPKTIAMSANNGECERAKKN